MRKPGTQGRIPQLDGIRGIAILLVLLGHYYSFLLEPGASVPQYFSTRILWAFWSGVDLFFVLSGFLIGGILIDQRESKGYYSVFYLRRICRIIPIYALLLFAVYAVYFFTSWQESESLSWMVSKLHSMWCYLFLVQNVCMSTAQDFGSDTLGVTWSLAVEEQFYLILPLLIRVIPAKRLPYVLGIIILLTPIVRVPVWFVPEFGRMAVFLLTPFRADALLLGVLGAWWIRQTSFEQTMESKRTLLVIAAWFLLIGALVLSYFDGHYNSYSMVNIGYTWFAVLYILFILLAITSKNRITLAILCSSPLCKLGLVSYFVYLFHEFFLGLSYHFLIGKIPSFENAVYPMFVALGVTFLAASASWKWFEKPLVRFGHRHQY